MNWIVNQRFDSISKIKSWQTPMLIIQGTEDGIILILMADDLFVPKSEPREMVIISQAGYTNVHEVEDQHYFFSLN